MRASLFLLVLFIFSLPLSAYAALVNINTADATLLDTLPGIGPSKAAAIVDYRTQNGPFTRIEDIQNVSGIGPSTYAGLEPFITVDNTNTADSSTTTEPTPVSTDNVSYSSTSSGGTTISTPSSSELSVHVGAATQNAVIDVPLYLSAQVTTKSGSVDGSAQISWSFGDGSSGESQEGSEINKTYRYAGTYLITVDAGHGLAKGHTETVVVVRPAQVRIVAITDDGITITNDANERLDLSDWRLSAGLKSFRVPHGTILLPKSSVLFPFAITNLPVTADATLSYSDGTAAARYVTLDASASPVAMNTVQLPASAASSNIVQTVTYDETLPAKNTSITSTAHADTAVSAPTAATKLAAVGAILLPASSTSSEATSAVNTHTSSLLRSPWTLGLLGVIVAASGAFILL